MNQWVDRVLSHSVWQELEALGPAIDEAVQKDGIDSSIIDDLERLRAVLAFVGNRLAGADPRLMNVTPLDGIGGALQTVISEIKAFITDSDVNRIATANLSADTILTHLPAINYPFVAGDWNALRDAGLAYRDTLEQSLRKVQTTFAQIQAKSGDVQQGLSKLGTEIEREREQIASLTIEFQSQFSTGQEKRTQEFSDAIQTALTELRSEFADLEQRLTELGSEIGTERATLKALASDFQSQFSTAQETRSREFAETQTSRQDKFGALIADYNQRLSDQNAEFSKQQASAFQQYEERVGALTQDYRASATTILDEIEAHKIQVERLVGVIGNLGVTSGYLKTANQARAITWIWQVITVLGMMGWIFFAYKAFLPVIQGEFTWEGFAGRVFLSLTVGVLAAYAASQADKYLETERRNRKLALELEAIGPYLAPLPVEKQEEFRLKFGERSFGRDEPGLRRKADKSPASVVDLLNSKQAREIISEIVRTTKS